MEDTLTNENGNGVRPGKGVMSKTGKSARVPQGNVGALESVADILERELQTEESRLLQVSIFTMLHKNVRDLQFSALLPDVVIIADEVDAQLKQQMLRFMAADAVATAAEV
jgi:hypothetical protein